MEDIIKNLLQKRAAENSSYQQVLIDNEEEDRETRQKLLKQKKRDDVALEMDFDSLEDRKKQKRLDSQIKKYLDNIV